MISFKTGRMFYQGMENKDGKQWCGYKIANQYYVPNLLESCAKDVFDDKKGSVVQWPVWPDWAIF